MPRPFDPAIFDDAIFDIDGGIPAVTEEEKPDTSFGWISVDELIISKQRIPEKQPIPAISGYIEQDAPAQDESMRVIMRQRVLATISADAPFARSDLSVKTSMARRNERTLSELLVLEAL